jgi:hypothetical protein
VASSPPHAGVQSNIHHCVAPSRPMRHRVPESRGWQKRREFSHPLTRRVRSRSCGSFATAKPRSGSERIAWGMLPNDRDLGSASVPHSVQNNENTQNILQPAPVQFRVVAVASRSLADGLDRRCSHARKGHDQDCRRGGQLLFHHMLIERPEICAQMGLMLAIHYIGHGIPHVHPRRSARGRARAILMPHMPIMRQTRARFRGPRTLSSGSLPRNECASARPAACVTYRRCRWPASERL